MSTSDMIRELCKQQNISLSELSRRIGQSRQNFCKKMQRGTLTTEELTMIADIVGAKFEQSFTLPDGNKIKIGN